MLLDRGTFPLWIYLPLFKPQIMERNLLDVHLSQHLDPVILALDYHVVKLHPRCHACKTMLGRFVWQ